MYIPEGLCVIEIRKRLREESIHLDRQALQTLILKLRNHTIVADLPRRRMQSKITEEMRSIMEEAPTNYGKITTRKVENLLAA